MISKNSWTRIGVLLFAATAPAIMNPSRAADTDKVRGQAEHLLAQDRPLVIAHRGFSAIAPENTLPAFEFAVTAGADLVELDYHHSKEGIPVVIHDYELDRTTDSGDRWGAKKIRVESRSTDELRMLDAGKWFHSPFAGIRLPLLTEALDSIQKKSVTLIERKAGDAATCARLLRERDLVNRVIVQAFDWSYLRDLRAEEPRQILAALGPPSSHEGKKLSDEEKILSSRWTAEVKEIGAQIVAWNRNVSKDAIASAHDIGLKVWIYTINDPELATRLLDLGVDGIITDNPSLIWRTIALRALH